MNPRRVAYHTTTGLLTKEVIEPRSGDVTGCVSSVAGDGITRLTTYLHDSYGNRKTMTVSGPGIATRTTTTEWGRRASDGTVTANGRYPVKTTNALGHVGQRWYGAAHGGRTRLTGPNGLSTWWDYDGLGRVVRERRADGTRTDTAHLQDVYESFTYDTLHRLTGATVYDGTTDTQLVSKSYSYDAIGNIVNKSDVGAADYVYGTGNAAGAGDAGPHAVVSAGGATYAYDDNGNLTSGAGRALTWTSFNKPQTVATTSTTTTFAYGPERARIRQQKVQGATTTTIKYVGTLFEQITRTGEATKYVHYLFAGGERIAVYTTDNAWAPTPSETLRYVHTDHLGSIDTLTDESGAVVERLSYDAWGKRRVASGANAWRDAVVPIAGAETRRGFTGHEHLDEFALIHMNGRVYDPTLGRFLR